MKGDIPGVSRSERKSDPVCLVLGVRIGAVAARCNSSAVDGDENDELIAGDCTGEGGIEKLIGLTGDPNRAANVLLCGAFAAELYERCERVPEKPRDACAANERSSCSRAGREGER